MKYLKVTSGTFSVPTDWKIWVIYNPSIMPGELEMRSWVTDYTKDDISKISGEWKPTGTAYIDYEKIKNEEEAKTKLI